jgi:hypothetical protein
VTDEAVSGDLLEIIRRDHEAAGRLARGASSSVDRTRTFGLTLVAAVVGFSLTSHTWELSAAGVLLGAAIAVVDGFYSWQYERSVEHIRRIEAIEALRYKSLLPPGRSARSDLPGAARQGEAGRPRTRLESKVRGFKPGVYSELKKFRIRELRYLQPFPVFRGLYPAVIVASLLAGVFAYTGSSSTTVVRLEPPISICASSHRALAPRCDHPCAVQSHSGDSMRRLAQGSC